jgi:hypothetical protein
MSYTLAIQSIDVDAILNDLSTVPENITDYEHSALAGAAATQLG